jgi:hypothetical protein
VLLIVVAFVVYAVSQYNDESDPNANMKIGLIMALLVGLVRRLGILSRGFLSRCWWVR